MLEKRLDNLKVFATLLVVLGHVGVFYSGLGVLEFKQNEVIRVMTWLIYSFHMPLFFFISGVIYEICTEKGKYRKAGKFIGKKGKRLIVPYVFWGIVVVTPVMELLGFTEDGVGKYIINGILLGRNNRHLWYLLSLFCMFLVTDGIRRSVKRKKHGGLCSPLLLFLPFSITGLPVSSTLAAPCGAGYILWPGLFWKKMGF